MATLNPDDAPGGYVAVPFTNCKDCAGCVVAHGVHCTNYNRADGVEVMFVKRDAAPKAVAPAAPAAPAALQAFTTKWAPPRDSYPGVYALWRHDLEALADALAAPTAAPMGEPVAPSPNTPSDARALAQMLTAGADDPMWANHAEVNKATLRRAADALRFMAGQVECLAECAKTAPAPVERQPLTGMQRLTLFTELSQPCVNASGPFDMFTIIVQAVERDCAEAWGVKLAGGADKGGAA